MERNRVSHVEYNKLGEVTHTVHGEWVHVKWDDGTETTEHVDDLRAREIAR